MTDAELLEAVTYAICRDAPTTGWHVLAAERAIAAVRASGRLAPEVGGDVVEAAAKAHHETAFSDTPVKWEGLLPQTRTWTISRMTAAAPIIATATEAKVREDLSGWADGLIEANQGSTAHQAGVRFGAKMLLERIAIRTGAAS